MTFSRSILDTNLASADPYLNKLLIKSPHGKANAKDVAQKLGMSQRTLARHLASEGLTFVEMLKELRIDLAKRDLADRDLSISQNAWLLGYKDISSFTHAFKRWTGDTPRTTRQAGLSGV